MSKHKRKNKGYCSIKAWGKTWSIAPWQEKNLIVLRNEGIDVYLDMFDGNPFEYHYFTTMSQELVKKQMDD